MNTHKMRDTLGRISFSADLSDDMLNRLAGIAQGKSFPAGSILFEEGTKVNDLYMICGGRVALDMNRGPGTVRVLTLGPGDLIAWSSALESGIMTTSAVALEDTEVIAVPAAKLLAECERDHELGYEIMRRLAGQLARRLIATRIQLAERAAT